MSSTFFDHKMEDRWTWISPNKQYKKVLDYILANKQLQKYMQDCKVMSSIDFDSDHRALVAKLRTPTTKSKRPTKPAWNEKPRNSNNEDYTQLANNEISKKYFQTLESILRKNSNTSQCVSTHDIQIRSSTLIDNIKAASKQSLPKRLRSSDDPTQA